MSHEDTSVPSLPSTADDQMANILAKGCTNAEIYNVAPSMPIYPVPAHQSMPTQERV
jgi:hypothetical protein